MLCGSVRLTDDAYQYVWFCSDTTLAMPFAIDSMQVGNVSLDEDEEFSNNFYFFFCMVGTESFCYDVMLYS